MSDVIVHPPAMSRHYVSLKRWEYYVFVAEAWMMVAATGVLCGILRHVVPAIVAPAMIPAGVTFAAPLVLLPVYSVYVRVRKNVDVPALSVLAWSLIVAVALGAIIVVVQP